MSIGNVSKCGLRLIECRLNEPDHRVGLLTHAMSYHVCGHSVCVCVCVIKSIFHTICLSATASLKCLIDSLEWLSPKVVTGDLQCATEKKSTNTPPMKTKLCGRILCLVDKRTLDGRADHFIHVHFISMKNLKSIYLFIHLYSSLLPVRTSACIPVSRLLFVVCDRAFVT